MLILYQKLERFALRIIEKLENQKITLGNWLLSFFAIVFLRIFLEALSSGLDYFQFESNRLFFNFTFFHLPVFFLLGALFLILLLHFLTKEKIEKVSKIALFAFLIILLPPIIDLIASSGQGGLSTGYNLLLETPGNLLHFFQWFLTFFLYDCQGVLFFGEAPSYMNTADSFFINYGVRIQLAFIFLGFIWYVFLKTKNIFKVLLGLIVLYFIKAIVYYFPSALYQVSASLNPAFDHHRILFSLYFIAVCFLASLWFYIYHKEKFLSLFSNLRFSRIAHSIVLLALGLYLGGLLGFDLNLANGSLIVLAVISLFLCWLGEMAYGDLSDEKIDRISNPSRPLPAGKFTREEFQRLGNIFLITSYLTAFVAGYAFFVFLLLRGFVGYLYAYPPFRLKRFPLLATFSRALAFLFTIYAGFLLISTNTIFDFPAKLALFAVVAFTLGTTVKDIRDYQGDRAGGVYTIPVIFGLEKGKKIIGLLVFIVFVLTPLFFFDYFKILILPALLAGILSCWLISKGKDTVKEALCLFLIYFVFGLFFILNVFK
jgi:4-hydroxybenzoate polyprenyltransferase